MYSDYRDYLCAIADELGCEFRFHNHTVHGMMYVEFGYVEGPEPYKTSNPQTCFAVGLHELGHFYHGHTQSRPPMEHLRHYFDNGVLRSEAEAWEFALEHFEKRGEVIYRSTRDFMWNVCLGSYYRGYLSANGGIDQLWNGSRHHIPFRYDEPDEYFWRIKSAILGEVMLNA